MLKKTLIFVGALFILCSLNALAGGTNSVFLRMDNMLNEMDQSHYLSSEEIQDWKVQIKILRNKVDERIKLNGGGMNRYQDKDIFDELDSKGKKILDIYNNYKKDHTYGTSNK
jgi:hypothetical protein